MNNNEDYDIIDENDELEEFNEKEIKQISEPEPWYKGPAKIILALFLVLIIVLMTFPYYSIKMDPEPKYIPTIDEVIPSDFNVTHINSSDYYVNVKPADPLTKQVSTKISTISCDGNMICQAKSLFYFARNNLEYVAEKDDYIMSFSETLYTRGGDCDDHAVFLANLLQASGFNTRFVFVPNHVFLQVWLPDAAKKYKVSDDWVYLDPTCSDCSFGELVQQSLNADKKFIE